ncbi:unnamed protein product [Heligmosomoides polygyrus]|uniref:Uncharacterized protein n=1 Tax=Heligmosomoides polygyrus TaxID=6339 RepID=A0A183GRQ7_HELPZ|nr:unnamed protein product [Heligmosomoides polygyrus]
MSYSNHYNYQVGLGRPRFECAVHPVEGSHRFGGSDFMSTTVAVIFAILLGGMLLLGLVVGGIYFVCVNNMRDSDKKRLHSGRNSSAAWPAQTPTYSAPYREGPTTAAVLSSPTPAQNFEYVPPSALGLIVCIEPKRRANSFAPRSSVLQTPANVSSHYMPQQQYSTQVPLVTPTRVEEFAPGAQYRPLQPDVIYTQVRSLFFNHLLSRVHFTSDLVDNSVRRSAEKPTGAINLGGDLEWKT